MKNNNSICRELNLKQTAKFLKSHDNFVILTHASPDGDTLGSAYALYYGLKEIGKSAEVICPDIIPVKFNYFVTRTDHISKDNMTVVAVDVADSRLLGALQEEFGKRVDLNIDHHISNVRFAKELYLDHTASATCEMIFELLEKLKVNINDVTAKALYTGIATDTGCFKYSNVTAKTHLIAARLFEYGIDTAEINRIMFDTKSKQLLELEKKALETAEYYFEDKCIVLAVTTEMLRETGCTDSDMEGIAVISRSVEGILAGVTIKQTGEESYKVSLRTFPPVDASYICKLLGGGGHKAAAGASVKGTLNEVKQKVIEAVRVGLEG